MDNHTTNNGALNSFKILLTLTPRNRIANIKIVLVYPFFGIGFKVVDNILKQL